MMESSPCTLADVARESGFSITTVSMALRNDARISQATQNIVRKAARKLRYQPDPYLAALVARRDRGRSRRVFANLAALVDSRWYSRPRLEWLESFLSGMKTASARLGYHLEVLRIQEDLGRSANRILHARGIRGIALLPLLDDAISMEIDWERYASVVLDNSLTGRRMNRVGSDAFAAMQITCEKLADLGYRRVGLVHEHGSEKRMRYEWLGALGKEHFLPGGALAIVPPYLPESLEEAGFLAWIEKERPECVVTNHDQTDLWLRQAGYRIPEDIGLSYLVLRTGERPGFSGTFQHLDFAGETAIEQLHTSLLIGRIGIPERPKEILILPDWIPGTTLRSRADMKPAKLADGGTRHKRAAR